MLLQTEKSVTSLVFVRFSRFFLPKCRPFYVVLEKGHGAGKKGMVLEKRALCRAKLKLARGNTKLEDLTVLKRSPDLLNNVKIG